MKFHTVVLATGWATLAFILAIGVGCGGGGGVNKLTVTGTVTYDGKPVDHAAIEFLLQEANVKGGSNATGAIVNGKFSVSNVSPGKNVVTVRSSTVVASEGPATYADRGKMPAMTPEGQRKAAMDSQKAAAASAAIPSDAPGNGQTFDIGGKDGTTLDIKILKK